MDSGNLAGALMALADGLRQLAGRSRRRAGGSCSGLLDTAEVCAALARASCGPARTPSERALLVAVLAAMRDTLDGSGRCATSGCERARALRARAD